MTALEACAARFKRLFPGGKCEAPSSLGLRTIKDRLGFQVPEDFVEFATLCPGYCGWLVSIGEDFESPVHILRLNATYHSPDYAMLPPELILINHGYDGDLNCYDLSKKDERNRLSICYVEAIESEFPNVSGSRQHIGFSLAEYLDPLLTGWERIR